MNSSKRVILAMMIPLFMGSAGPRADTDLVVVMNTNSGIERLSRDQVINIFLGRFRQLPNGATALPVD